MSRYQPPFYARVRQSPLADSQAPTMLPELLWLAEEKGSSADIHFSQDLPAETPNSELYLILKSDRLIRLRPITEPPETKVNGVYVIIARSTGEKYVGATKLDVTRRILNHRSQLKRNKSPNAFLQRAAASAGLDALVWGLLEAKPQDHHASEQRWMDELTPELNICAHAGTTRGLKHPPKTDFQIESVRQSRLGKTNSPEHKAATAERNRQRVWTAESREKAARAKRKATKCI